MEEYSPRQQSPLSQLLIAVGIVLINIYIFNLFSQWLCIRLFKTDIELLLKNHLFDNLDSQQINALRFSQFFTSFGGFIMSSLVIAKVFQQDAVSYLRLDKRPATYMILPGFLLFAGMMPVVQQLLAWNELLIPDGSGPLRDLLNSLEKQNNRIYELLLRENSGYMYIINLLVMALVPAIGEEFFFRGILFRIFERWTGRQHAAVWLTSVLFALIHFQIFKVIPMAVLAGVFAYLLSFTQSLWPGIVLHFLNNALVVTGYALINQGKQYYWLKDDYIFPLWVSAVGLVISAACFYYLSKNHQAANE